MSAQPRPPSRWRVPIAAALIIVLGPGCSSILDTEREIAAAARVVLEGSSPVPLTMITSTRYVGARDPQTNVFRIELIDADTVQVTQFPLDRRYPLDQNGRFFVRVTNPNLDVTATVRLRVFLDAELVYDVRADMRDASLEYVFVYF